jgi:hypothetical protein
MASQVYWNGDWFEALEATAPGESPSAFPEKWAKVEIPADLERFLIGRAYASLLPDIGQNDKAQLEDRRATAVLDSIAYTHGQSTGAASDHRSEVLTR